MASIKGQRRRSGNDRRPVAKINGQHSQAAATGDDTTTIDPTLGTSTIDRSTAIQVFHRAELLHELKDGTLENQSPDSKKIVAAMKRAVGNADVIVGWNQVDSCPTPLQHECATVKDHYFADFKTKPVENYEKFDGRLLMTHVETIMPGE